LKVCIFKAGEILQSCIPRNRRLREMVRQFDREHGVKTEYTIRLEDLDVANKADFCVDYGPTDTPAMERMLNALPIAHENFVFIDLGCGMGRALLMASEFPFKKIIGVEFSSELHRAAQHNTLNFKSERQKCRNFELVYADARENRFPAENTVFYLFNPFRKPIMTIVLENSWRSLEEHPREILIAYYNCKHKDLLESAAFLTNVDSGEARWPFAIYQNKGIAMSGGNDSPRMAAWR
jgi:SAM-dependent methyltransferase